MTRSRVRRGWPGPAVRDYPRAVTSRWSIGSTDSVLSLWSDHSVLSIGSVGSCASVGSVGSFASAFSIGSSQSLGSWLSHQSPGSVLARRSGASTPVLAAGSVVAVAAHLWFWRRRVDHAARPRRRALPQLARSFYVVKMVRYAALLVASLAIVALAARRDAPGAVTAALGVVALAFAVALVATRRRYLSSRRPRPGEPSAPSPTG